MRSADLLQARPAAALLLETEGHAHKAGLILHGKFGRYSSVRQPRSRPRVRLASVQIAPRMKLKSIIFCTITVAACVFLAWQQKRLIEVRRELAHIRDQRSRTVTR